MNTYQKSIIKCKNCNIEFLDRKSKKGRQRVYCSDKCRYSSSFKRRYPNGLKNEYIRHLESEKANLNGNMTDNLPAKTNINLPAKTSRKPKLKITPKKIAYDTLITTAGNLLGNLAYDKGKDFFTEAEKKTLTRGEFISEINRISDDFNSKFSEIENILTDLKQELEKKMPTFF